jgi:hypothetical protein
VPKPGEPADVWWLGFDCGHAFDLAPGLAAMLGRAAREAMMRDTYRTLAYVRAEVEGLAEQAAEAAR